MIVYRIVDSEYIEGAYSGKGAEEFPGRWNYKGIPIVYTSESLSLCALELFVHLNDRGRKGQYVSISATISKSISILSIPLTGLPDDWNSDPPITATRSMGSEWARSKRSAVLKVPSAVVSGEFNYLINPHHPSFSKIVVHSPVPFVYDPRMWKH